VEIIAGPIMREADGLAMSSRNNYLSPVERATGSVLSQTLQLCRQQIELGVSPEEAEKNAVDALKKHGFIVDYVSLRKARNLQPPVPGDDPDDNELVILAAAKIGNTRLIDNVKFKKPTNN
jgi:pantoate--beta-alanine ligase